PSQQRRCCLAKDQVDCVRSSQTAAKTQPVFSRLVLVTWTTQCSARPFISDLAIDHYRLAIYENVFHADRIAQRIIVGRNILDRCWVEDRNIRKHSRSQDSAICDPNSTRSLRGHFANRFFEAHCMLLSHVFVQNV